MNENKVLEARTYKSNGEWIWVVFYENGHIKVEDAITSRWIEGSKSVVKKLWPEIIEDLKNDPVENFKFSV